MNPYQQYWQCPKCASYMPVNSAICQNCGRNMTPGEASKKQGRFILYVIIVGLSVISIAVIGTYLIRRRPSARQRLISMPPPYPSPTRAGEQKRK